MRPALLLLLLLLLPVSVELRPDYPAPHWSSCVVGPSSPCSPRLSGPTRASMAPLPQPFAELVSWPDTLAATRGGAPCVDAHAWPRVIDLTCTQPWASGEFHRHHDCAAQLSELFELAHAPGPPTLVLVPAYFADLWAFLRPDNGTGSAPLLLGEAALAVAPDPSHRSCCANSTACVAVSPGTELLWHSGANLQWCDFQKSKFEYSHPSLVALNAARLRRLALGRLRPPPPPGRAAAAVTFVERGGTRSVANLGALRSRFAARLPWLAQQSYGGGEGLAATVRLFAASRVVVGFHGAGLANALWAPPGGVLAELTLRHVNASGGLLRTVSCVAAAHGGLRHLVVGVDVARVAGPAFLAASAAALAGAGPTRRDEHMLTLAGIVLPDDAMDEVVARVAAALEGDGAGVGA